MSRALYRKYRSKSLDEIVGQQHVTDILARSLAQGRIAHAYLLTGPRGIGKTSIARILAHEINKLPYTEEATHLDIIEIDAASNNGVEDVRDLREKVQIAPVSAQRKVYIIDEVHMLSKAAFNALLKTLEEPPEHAVFILATTDVDKLPPTIISRTQRFSLRPIGAQDATMHLKKIATSEKIKITDEALELIALRGEGSFRDSISLLDQLASLANQKTGITQELVEQSLGLASHDLVKKLLEAYVSRDLAIIVALLDESRDSGVQPSVLARQLLQDIRLRIADSPQLLPLLDALLEVAKSSSPDIKLLTVLGAHAVPKPKSAALIASPPEIKASVEDLKKLAETKNPTDKSSGGNVLGPYESTLQPEADQTPEPSSSFPAQSPASKDVDEPENAAPPATRNQPIDFEWNKLVEYTREHFVAIYSVLSKCSYELAGQDLTLYTGNAFYKKKLDDSKHRINLTKSLEAIGADGLSIETIGTPPPPKDSTAAAVAAIMGGGEEVKLGE